MNKQEYVNYLSQLGPMQVWAFTKQTVTFKKLINSVRIFESWKLCADDKISLQEYFNKNACLYNVKPNYRSLITAQFLGLITCDSGTYKKEKTTQVYKDIIFETDPEKLNKIISEQLLKFKVGQITYKGKRDYSHNLYPIIFIYQVLKKLKTEYAVSQISFDELLLFVMTRNNHDELNDCVKTLTDSSDYTFPKELLKSYKSNSRIETMILNNIDLFLKEKNFIKINPLFENEMDNFLKKHTDIFSKLNNKNQYIKFLRKNNNFNISLINSSNYELADETLETNDEYFYAEEVNKQYDFSENEINSLMNYFTTKLKYSNKNLQKIEPNSKIGALALHMCDYKCCVNKNHSTFTSKRTHKAYMEAHHLIPRKYQQKYYNAYNKNIDCIQNIVSLCPNCHRTLHHGIFEEKKCLLTKLYDYRKEELKSIGIDITFTELLSYYI